MSAPAELIRRKRDGAALTTQEIEAFFGGFLRSQVEETQMAAMLMAITLRGMDLRETADLTRVMRDSGETLAWSGPRQRVVDKHSTGGIGDKTSVLLIPLCEGEGLLLPMMAGRSLGHTGGTLDKLEAVGFRVQLTAAEARAQVETLGGVIMGQTEALAPLDRRLYAMRDVTGTVESIPLIVGSILSKKLAEGLGGLVMDVKFGSGAFMQERAKARELAQALKSVAAECGLTVRCVLSSMNTPLGRTAGNALEIAECLEVLQGGGPADVRELTLVLGVEMVRLAYPERSEAEVRARLARRLDDGAALASFQRLAAKQGADPALLASAKGLYRAKVQRPVLAAAKKPQHVQAIDVRALGIAIIDLGGGRKRAGDKVDPWVGLSALKAQGEPVAPGEPLAVVHARDEASAEAAARTVAAAYQLGDQASAEPLIAEIF